MKERVSNREIESGTMTRRSFLSEAWVLMIPVLLRTDTPETEVDDIFDVMAQVEKELFKVFEQSEQGEFPVENAPVPEWEQTGSDILITVSSDASDVENELENNWNKILRSFMPNTHVHVVSTTGTKAILENKLPTSYPHLKFSVYELPLNDFNGTVYSQDMLFSSGRRDGRGRFIIYTSKLDKLSGTEESQDDYLFTSLFGDEILASNYPDRFISRQVPLRCEGGDLQSTKLPNGKTALILGDANFRANVGAVINGANANGRKFTNDNFDYGYLLTKLAYQKFFGVDEVIVLNEKGLLEDLPGQTMEEFVLDRSEFYHADMCVRTAVDPSGRHVAFITSTDAEKTRITERDVKHLRNIRLQFEKLGFDIVELPCGRFPSLNYTNVLIFKPQDGSATVMLPCYGESLDDEAARLYQSRGFNVIKTDMSDLMKRSEGTIQGGGSLHCLVEVLS